MRTADQRGQPVLVFHAALSSALLFCRVGRLAEAVAMAERALDAGELLPVGLPLARAVKGLALLESGQLSEAERYADPPDPAWYLSTGYGLRLRGTLAYRRGHIDAACRTFSELERCYRRWGLVDPAGIGWAADAIDAHLAAGHHDDVQGLVDWLDACPLPSRWPKATALLGRAGLAVRHGDLDFGESSLAEAARLLDDVPMPLAQCQTLTAYGSLLIRCGRHDRARPVLADAVQRAQTCGAGWHLERATAQLRRAGGRPHRLPPGELSPQEKAVARLARAGRTNREIAEELFLSVNTVETHLAHTYRKLAINRRGELGRQDLD